MHRVVSQLFPSGQSIEKRKAEAKKNPKATAAKAKTKGKKRSDVKTEPEAGQPGGHFDNLNEEDCGDEPMDDEDLDGSPCEDETNGEEVGDDGTIFGEGNM